MDELAYVWDHFKFNADQRLKTFNFFILLSIFADGGVFTALEKDLSSALLVLLGLFVVLLAVVFWIADTRSRNLLDLTIPALKEIESSFGEAKRLFANDVLARNKWIRYTFAFRLLFWSQMLFGAGVSVYGLLDLLKGSACGR